MGTSRRADFAHSCKSGSVTAMHLLAKPATLALALLPVSAAALLAACVLEAKLLLVLTLV